MKPQPIITKALASKAKTSSSKSSPAEKSKSPNLGRIVARRILKENTRKGGGIEALIGTPYPDGKHWACPFYIDGLDMDGVQKGMGEDSLQALLSAIAGVRAILERSGRKFFWLDSELGAFIPLFVSQRGKHFEQRIKAAMIREIKRDSYLEIERRGSCWRKQAAAYRQRGISLDKIEAKLSPLKSALDDWKKDLRLWRIPRPK